MAIELKNKKVLITAGPTWVALDAVRIISNIATGETGILLAKKFLSLGAKVTLFLGPVHKCRLDKRIKVIDFAFFEELSRKLNEELELNQYDYILHSAAVSDFKPENGSKSKIESGKTFCIKLKPLPKIIKKIRSLNPEAKLVMFKLEIGVSDKVLKEKAIAAAEKINADFVVANSLNPYKAFLINKNKEIIHIKGKFDLIRKLILVLSNN